MFSFFSKPYVYVRMINLKEVSMTYVFIVSTGERGVSRSITFEGSSVLGVFASEEKATEVALSQESPWVVWSNPEKFTDYDGREGTIWWHGCNYVKVVRHQVQ